SVSCSGYLARRHRHPSPTRRSSDLSVVVVGTAIHRLAMLAAQAGLRLELAVIAAVHGRQHAYMHRASQRHEVGQQAGYATVGQQDRKSTRLNSSHVKISYAVFCLKK